MVTTQAFKHKTEAVERAHALRCVAGLTPVAPRLSHVDERGSGVAVQPVVGAVWKEPPSKQLCACGFPRAPCCGKHGHRSIGGAVEQRPRG